MEAVEVELTAGDPERAAEIGREGVDELETLGEQGWLSTVAGYTAEALYRLGRDDEAWELANKAEATGASDDVITYMLFRQVRAKLLARRGDLDEAERLASDAVALGEPTDAPDVKANARRDLAVVYAAAGKRDEALHALAEAQALYEQKGHTAGISQVEKLRSELVATLGA